MGLHPVGMRICGYWTCSGSHASAECFMQLYMQCVVAMYIQEAILHCTQKILSQCPSSRVQLLTDYMR